jgi:hypothetical protein
LDAFFIFERTLVLVIGQAPAELHAEKRPAIGPQGQIRDIGQDSATNCMANGHVMFGDFSSGGALFDGNLKLSLGDGTKPDGSLLQLRAFTPDPNVPPPDISGDYQGSASSDATGQQIPMSIHFQHVGPTINAPPTTLFSANLGVNPCIFPQGFATVSPYGEQTTIGGNPAISYELLVIGPGRR